MDNADFAALIDRIRGFVRGVGLAHEAATERDAALPAPVIEALRELGTFGWSIPVRYGGSELNTEQLARAFLELAQGAVAYRDQLPLAEFAGRVEPRLRQWLEREFQAIVDD